MCKKMTFLALVLAFGLTSLVHAATIIWVSDNKNPDPDTLVPADQAWVDLLAAQPGYIVNLDFRNKEGNTRYDENSGSQRRGPYHHQSRHPERTVR